MAKRKRAESVDSNKSVESGAPAPTSEQVLESAGKRFHYTNKQRVLIIASRGITARHRYFMEDLKKMIPHHKKDNKLDNKGDIQAVNEIADVKSCNQVIYVEARKHQDLYIYIGKTPQGPSAKFHVVNLHTMDELRLTGNSMLGSRPLLNFDEQFENTPHHRLMKALLTDAFGVPLGHPKSKPFLDHVMSFFIIKNNICKGIILCWVWC
jgi:ribosome biogenesis protein BRX1